MIESLTLLRPLWFLALPIVAVLALRAAWRSAPLGDWSKAVDPHLMALFARSGALLGGRRQANLAAALAAGVLALALTGPAIERPEAATFRNLDATVVVLDLSRSVTEGGRFKEARQAAQSVAEAAGTRSLALIVYAGDAYTALSPTNDRETLATTLFALDADTVPDRGSHPERGLALARRTLAEANVVAADVVLISDGDGVGQAAEREAAAIRDKGWQLHALFVPAAKALPPGAPRPDRAALDRLSGAGGGRAADIDNPQAVLDRVGASTAQHLAAGGFGVLAFADFGRWLLLLALVPALLLFRRSA
ncbi:Ca-activated chloride channel family protein [Methylorubrum rhodesianum]|uniref:VWA domain-containing protein n=2 Tax=Methylorubrum rhodesianum TaxID=29427 RepID=A0ABU9Z6W2_9HYPH|nr:MULTISPECIES: vWA domain-containing protein [Methylorubrum]MBB5763590.1 Ca-activated chloride channel family protein [Methylorubrum rhodesianum]MBI1689856.1 VWA domain-containing protein [Methylorubrum sp. DB1722]MBK3402190.1 VWA domain-containing protein [Methylorubrum rhodesianum]MBY0140176.1 VWA domain-containing protein [Methylorubrum populi]